MSTLDTIKKGIKMFFIVPSTVSFIYLVGYEIWLKNSDAYAVAKAYVEHNHKIKQQTGGVKGFGFFVSGLVDDLKNDEADLLFTVKGNHKNLQVQAKLHLYGDKWKVVKISSH